MKHNMFISLFLICSISTYSQSLFKQKAIDLEQEKIQSILDRDATASVIPIDLDIELLSKQQDISFTVDGVTFLLSPMKFDVRGVNNFTASYCSYDRVNSMVVSVFGDKIKGNLFLENGVWAIETIDSGEYVLVAIDQTAFQEEDEPYSYNYDNRGSASAGENANGWRHTEMRAWPVISVLVMYTNEVASAHSYSDIVTEIFNAEAISNISFGNSDLDCLLKVVYIGHTNYNEHSIFKTNLDRFVNLSDGFMDEVQSLREQYSADVCMLICNNGAGKCGRAATIYAGADSAYCLVKYSCATENLSFPHEIGHLAGCRHDIYMDPTLTPYPHGHGFIKGDKRWRTIMAYNNFCSANGYSCVRLPYWSNITVPYAGDAMGDETYCNNAKVWGDRAEQLSYFRITDNKTVTSLDVINADFAHIFADHTLKTSGAEVTISAGNNITFQAGDSIFLRPGFHSEYGSFFHAYISDYDSAATHYTYNILSMPKKQDITSAKFNMLCSVSPNPIESNSKVVLTLDGDYSEIKIDIVDLFGRNICNVASEKYLQEGEHFYQINSEYLPFGVMFVLVTSHNHILTSLKISKL